MVFRFLLRNWLHGLAQDKIREKVAEAAREQFSQASGENQSGKKPQSTEGDLLADVGVVFALSIEAGGTVDMLDRFERTHGSGFTVQLGRLGKHKLAVFESGAGPERAAAATEALIDAHRPRWIISAGFAGGLLPSINRHDIVMADSVANDAGRRLAVDLEIDIKTLPPSVHVGRILSLDRIARLPEEKQSLGRRHDALAVDLESFAVAEVCRRRAVPLLGVRIITDAMDEQLPVDVQKLTDQPTAASRSGAAVGAVCRRPSSFMDMMRLKENALVASDRLARFLEGIVEQLK